MNETKKSNEKSSNPPNPTLEASFISKFTFWWTRHIIRKGYSQPLNESDIYENHPDFDSSRITHKFTNLWEEELKTSNPSVLRIIYKGYGMSIIFFGLLFQLTETVGRVIEPLCLGGLVSYFAEEQTDISKEQAYLYALGITFFSPIIALTFHPWFYYMFCIGTKIRLALSGLIYRKCLKLSKSSSNDGLNGKAINIMSNDLGKFDICLVFLHDLWKGPVESLLLGTVMFVHIQYAAIIGIGFMFLFIPLQMWAAKKAAHYRIKSTEKTDLRVKLMNEIIQGVQVIKMYAWEKSFARLIANVRKKEIHAIRGNVFVHAGLQCTSMIAPFCIFVSLISYIYLGGQLTAAKLFTVSSCFNILNDSMIRFWPYSMTVCAEAWVSAKRTKDFLLAGLNKYLEMRVNQKRIVKDKSDVKSISLEKTTAVWDDGRPALRRCNAKIEKESLAAVVGSVGAGKSAFLQILLGEINIIEGRVYVNGSISYSSQEPWLFEGSIRDNIVFVEPFDQDRYQKVVKVCCLEQDLQIFPNGDMTRVGERGVSLSGGQKARVSLARAIYRKADIYLLDDPLSAVDTHVGKHIFERCIQGFLSNKIRVLITHQLQYLKNVENIILIKDGIIEAQGSYKELLKLGEFEMVSQSYEEQERIRRESFKEDDDEKSLLDQDDIEELQEVIDEDRQEKHAKGAVSLKVYQLYFRALGSNFYLFVIAFLFIGTRSMLTGIDFFLSRWVMWEEVEVSNSTMNTDNSTTTIHQNETIRQEQIITYAVLLICTLLVYVFRTFGFFSMCLRISYRMHDMLFRGITQASMYFFNINPSGRILNRFARDIGAIDYEIPETLIDCILLAVDLTGVIVIVAIANYWLLIPAVFLLTSMITLRHFYINTGRSIKRIEAILRSPVYSLTNQTFQGLSTIRAFKAEKVLEKEFHAKQNRNTAAWVLYLATCRAFAMWVEMICIIYIFCVVFSFLILEKEFSSGDVGLAILHSYTLIGTIQWGMQQTTNLENLMTSVERVQDYIESPKEAQAQSNELTKPNKEWPKNGKIEFINLKLKYSEKGVLILSGLNFTIHPMEKLGIVGRTGAGKSSIIQAIFRLAYNEGTVKIDGIDIEKMDLQDLRSKISIIPQDPVLFSGSLRFNLDPFQSKTDEEIWRALEDVELKSYVTSLIGGLNCKMYDGGSNFSVGQRQLVCLARAILRNNKILILDEATANIDSE
ncbi:ABCC4.2 family protein [Megaselia abdita]